MLSYYVLGRGRVRCIFSHSFGYYRMEIRSTCVYCNFLKGSWNDESRACAVFILFIIPDFFTVWPVFLMRRSVDFNVVTIF